MSNEELYRNEPKDPHFMEYLTFDEMKSGEDGYEV